MTRIVFLTHSAAPAGAELALLHLLLVRPADADVLVVFGEDGDVARRAIQAGIPTRVLAMDQRLSGTRRQARVAARGRQVLSLLSYARRLRRLLQEVGPDVVVGRSLKAVLYGRLATLGLGVTFVWDLHDQLTPAYLGRTSVLWSRSLSRLTDGVVVNSRYTLSTMHANGKPVLVLPPVVPVDERTTSHQSGNLRVLCLGRLSPWKGQDLAIRAFAGSLRDSGAVLTIAGAAQFGEDDYAEALQRLVTELGLGNQVRFAGHVDDPVSALVATDVLVHSSSLPEPFGTVVIEGMRAGCVVIATSPGGPAEIIEDGRTGLLVGTGRVDELCAALMRAAAMTPVERAGMSEAARRRADDYDPAKLTRLHLGWLSDLNDGCLRQSLVVGGPAR